MAQPGRLQINQFLKSSQQGATSDTNGVCPHSDNNQIADHVRRAVSDLNSLLGLIVTMRSGLDDLPPRPCCEIAQILNDSLPTEIKIAVATQLNLPVENFVVTEAVVDALETKAHRLLTGREKS